MKRLICIFLALLLLSGCAPRQEAEGHFSFTDDLGYSVSLAGWERVVSLYGSFGETWLLAGGALTGTTKDAITERALPLDEDIAIVGTVKEPNLEQIIALDPDFVILSADTAAQVKLHDALTLAKIPHAYYQVDTFDDYLAMLEQFCHMTGRSDLYEQNGLRVQTQIREILESVSGKAGPEVLLLRAYSTGVKAKGADNLAGFMLQDLGAVNIADRDGSLLENLSLEAIVAADPAHIFISVMGQEDAALTYLQENWGKNPAWTGLTAVREGRVTVLPKELFHYKPNANWGESYACLAQILYP